MVSAQMAVGLVKDPDRHQCRNYVDLPQLLEAPVNKNHCTVLRYVTTDQL